MKKLKTFESFTSNLKNDIRELIDDPLAMKDFKKAKKLELENDKEINDIFLEIQKSFNISNIEFKVDEMGHDSFVYKYNDKELEISRNMDDWTDVTWSYHLMINEKPIDCTSSLMKKIFNFFKNQQGSGYKRPSLRKILN